MRVAVLADTHFGIKNDSDYMLEYFMRFFTNTFFPYLKENGIDHVIHVGDLMDRRKYVSFVTYDAVLNQYIKPCIEQKIKTIITAGNHDCFFKNTNDINSPALMLTRHPEFEVYSKAETIYLPDGTPICLIPWIPDDSVWKDETLKKIELSSAKYAFGHLELNGFQYSPGITCETGHDRDMVDKFEGIYSGHFHYRHSGGKVYYLGTPYQMGFDDIGLVKGFHVFESTTGEIEFIPNPETLFDRIHYTNNNDPPVKLEEIKDYYRGKFVKLHVPALKTDPVAYDRYLTELVANAADVKVIEYNHSLDIDGGSEVGEIQDQPETETISTITMIMNEIDTAIPPTTAETIKVKARKLMRDLFTEVG